MKTKTTRVLLTIGAPIAALIAAALFSGLLRLLEQTTGQWALWLVLLLALAKIAHTVWTSPRWHDDESA